MPFLLALARRSHRSALYVLAALSAPTSAYSAHNSTHIDPRDLAAPFLFNGQSGERAYDLKGPLGGESALWERPSAGRFEFAMTQSGVTVRGSKTVDVKRTCKILIKTELAWLYQNRPSQSLERAEEYDFGKSVVSDAILAMRGDTPQAIILFLQGGDDFYCRETRINGKLVEPNHCVRAIEIVTGPGLRSDIIRSGFRRFSAECKNQL